MGRNLDGRLQAFTVVDGRLLTWSQTADGGWQGPDDLGNPGYPLAPGVSGRSWAEPGPPPGVPVRARPAIGA